MLNYWRTCVALPIGRLSQTFATTDARLGDWIRDRYYRIRGAPLGEGALRNLLATLRARAYFSSRRLVDVRLTGRTGSHPSIYIDLANTRGEAVVVTPQNWHVTALTEVAFRSIRGERPLPVPELEGSSGALTPGLPDCLPDLLHLNTENWNNVQTWLLAALRPKGPFPMLILKGPSGSGKSIMARILRAILDPVVAPLHPLPSREGKVMQLAYSSRILAFDHVTRMTNSVADALCRISSGTCVNQFDIARPILITASQDFKPRPDVAHRAITIELTPLHPLPPDDIMEAFERIWPKVLAALYTLLAASLINQAEPTTPLVTFEPQTTNQQPPTPSQPDKRITTNQQPTTPSQPDKPPTTNQQPPTPSQPSEPPTTNQQPTTPPSPSEPPTTNQQPPTPGFENSRSP